MLNSVFDINSTQLDGALHGSMLRFLLQELEIYNSPLLEETSSLCYLVHEDLKA